MKTELLKKGERKNFESERPSKAFEFDLGHFHKLCNSYQNLVENELGAGFYVGDFFKIRNCS